MGEDSTQRKEKGLVGHFCQARWSGGSFCNQGVLAALMEEGAWPRGMASPGERRLVPGIGSVPGGSELPPVNKSLEQQETVLVSFCCVFVLQLKRTF